MCYLKLKFEIGLRGNVKPLTLGTEYPHYYYMGNILYLSLYSKV